ncbi:MAG: hypothetical protein QM645_07170 [Asticcacaulis sp.]
MSVPPVATEACIGPDAQAVETVTDLAQFSLRQEEALLSCEAKRQALIDVIEEQ